MHYIKDLFYKSIYYIEEDIIFKIHSWHVMEEK